MFHLDHDRSTNTLTIRVKGFWTPDIVADLGGALMEKARELHGAGGDFDVIVESLEFPVQSNHVAELLTQIMVAGIALTSGRAAVVVGSQLNKLQAERSLVHPRLRVFRSLAKAKAWLAESPLDV